MVIEMDQNIQKPSIRFKGFTDAWEQCKLDDFGIATSGTSLESEFGDEGKYKVISIGSYSELSTYTDQGLRVEYNEKSKNRILNKNDLTMVLNDKTASGRIIGRVLLIENGDLYVFNQRTQRIQPFSDKYDSGCLYQLFNAPAMREKIIKQSQGNTQIYVNWSTIKDTDYLVPDIIEQRKIANFLSSLDSLITLHQRKYDKLVNTKKALLDKMFPKAGEVTPKLRFRGFTSAWEQYKLGDLGLFKSNGVDKLSKPNEIPVNLLNYMDVYSRRIVSNKNASELMQVTAKPSQLIENSVMKNDVFFTPTSETPEDIGRVYVIEETLNNTVYSYHLMRFRPNQGTYYPNFPNYSLMTENVRKQFFLAAKGVQRYVISKADFESIIDTIPEYKEQAKIGEFFRSIDQLITLHQRKYEKLQNIKKALLQKMFV